MVFPLLLLQMELQRMACNYLLEIQMLILLDKYLDVQLRIMVVLKKENTEICYNMDEQG